VITPPLRAAAAQRANARLPSKDCLAGCTGCWRRRFPPAFALRTGRCARVRRVAWGPICGPPAPNGGRRAGI